VTRDALADRLATADRVVEVGVGERPAVAAELAARGVAVTATDVRERSVPPGVCFRRDDVTDPDPGVYRGAGLVYALNCPAELQAPCRDLAASLAVPFRFTTLGAEEPVLPVERETLPGETLYTVRGPAWRGAP